jgi:hypothetical protein
MSEIREVLHWSKAVAMHIVLEKLPLAQGLPKLFWLIVSNPMPQR